jgi:site-specific DNA recombinase
LERAIAQTKEELALEKEREQAKIEIIPQAEHVLELYYKTDDPKQKTAFSSLCLKRLCTTRKSINGEMSLH